MGNMCCSGQIESTEARNKINIKEMGGLNKAVEKKEVVKQVEPLATIVEVQAVAEPAKVVMVETAKPAAKRNI